jgi:hypothetical protein
MGSTEPILLALPVGAAIEHLLPRVGAGEEGYVNRRAKPIAALPAPPPIAPDEADSWPRMPRAAFHATAANHPLTLLAVGSDDTERPVVG